MGKTQSAEITKENEKIRKVAKKRGPYFRWLRAGNVPASTIVSRKKASKPKKNLQVSKNTTQRKRIANRRAASGQKTENCNLSKNVIKEPLSTIDVNRQQSHADGPSSEFSYCEQPTVDNIYDENSAQTTEEHSIFHDNNSSKPDGSITHQLEEPSRDVCSVGIQDNLCASESVNQESLLIDDELKKLIHDPHYEEITDSMESNNSNCVVDLETLDNCDENYDLDDSEEENDSSSNLNSRGDIDSRGEMSNFSDDNDSDSDSEDLLAVAPTLHLSKENRINLLLLLATKKRHNLSYSASEDLMELAGVLSSDANNFLPSRHIMKTAIEMYSSVTLTEHHVCPVCGTYVGIVSTSSCKCKECSEEFSTDTNKNNGNIFLYLSLADQLKSIIKHCFNDIINPKERKKICQFNLEDIYDGKVYKQIVESGCVTLNVFVDGLQVSTTSKRSAWPVLGSVNELPLHLRRKYIVMGSLWLGLQKPKCKEYMKPFVKECNILQRNGVETRIGSRSIHFDVKILMCISDTIARPMLRNSTQFNGEHGCGLCYHPGVNMKYKKGTVRSYSFRHGQYPLRTHEEIMHDAAMAENEGKAIRGIKGKSVFAEIEGFNVASGLDLDSFHCLVNVAKRFAYLWFSKKFRTRPFGLFNKFEEVDGRLLSITPTSEVARAPRSLKERTDFRGHEWFHWVVEYSVPVLKSMLPARYLNHWCRLVHSVAVLMQNSVSKSDVGYCMRYLESFVKDIDDLYGPQHVTISVHLLIHWGESVFNFAQPFTHSAFMYESFNHEIKNFVKSSNGIAKQICKGMQLRIALKNMEEDLKDSLTEKQGKYLKKMTTASQAEPYLVIDGISFLGKPKELILPAQYLEALREECSDCCDLLIFERCLFQAELYHSSTYKKVTRQNNSVVLLDNQCAFCIDYFVVSSKRCYILGRKMPNYNRTKLCDIKLPHILVMGDPEDLIRCYPVSDINCKLLSFKINISATVCVTIGCINVLQQEMLR